MSYQNALQQYFDGELDDVGEDMLFGELAHNHDARREFNEHTKLRAAMQKERAMVTPPAHAAGAIFGALGYDLPAPVPVLKAPVAGGIAAKSGMFLKLLPYALTSVFSALVAIGIYAGFMDNSFKNVSELIAEKGTESSKRIDDSPGNLLKTGKSTAEISTQIPPENPFKSQHLPIKKRNLFPENPFKNNSENSLPDKNNLQKSNGGNTFKEQIAVIAKSDFINENIFNENSIGKEFKNHPAEKINLEIQQGLKEEVPSPLNFSVEMRSVMGKSFPDNSVAAQSELIKNTAISALYRIAKNHSIGVEAGREQFAQEYGKNINGETWNVRQNPLYWFGGAAYRFSLSDAEVFGFKNTFIPFAQIFAGAAQTGFLGKSQVGFKIVPESRVAFVLAAEGSLLLYGIDGSWNNTAKLGMSYGINVSF